MDVYAAGFDGAESLVLPKLGFGEVSQYMNLPAGTYAFSMRPQGSPATSTAALRVSASLDDGGIYTFAAFGRSDALETDLLTDDMAAPGAGQARVRIIQGAGDSGPGRRDHEREPAVRGGRRPGDRRVLRRRAGGRRRHHGVGGRRGRRGGAARPGGGNGQLGGRARPAHGWWAPGRAGHRRDGHPWRDRDPDRHAGRRGRHGWREHGVRADGRRRRAGGRGGGRRHGRDRRVRRGSP